MANPHTHPTQLLRPLQHQQHLHARSCPTEEPGCTHGAFHPQRHTRPATLRNCCTLTSSAYTSANASHHSASWSAPHTKMLGPLSTSGEEEKGFAAR